MASFFGKLKSSSEAKTAQGGSTPSKKDSNAVQPTPLERMLQTAGPLRDDGSDKFFGLENFGNTCYCNSILQCLYYTPPFRERVLSYPQRATRDSINKAAANAPPRNRTVQPTRPNQPANPGGPPKPDDKDSPEHKKKLALAAGPVVNMSYQNSSNYSMEESIYSSLKDLFEAIVIHEGRHGVVSPIRFLEVLRKENEMFRSAMHQDAHEFFNLVLNSVMDTIEDQEKKTTSTTSEPNDINKSTGKKSDNSVVSWPSVLPVPAVPSRTKWLRDMFEGTMTSETRCLTCETVSQRDEAFLDLSVDLEQHSSVTSCLNRFSEEEMLCERNKFHCDNCGGLQEAEKRMKIKKLPEVLALHLKRFKYTEDLQRLQKLHHKVVYPYHLRLFNTTDDAEDPDRLYELYAVVVHIGGGPYHGHYVSIIKTEDRGWLLFDDEMVEPVDKSYVRNFFGEKSGMASAYVLFYRHTTGEAVRQEQNSEGRRQAPQSSNGMIPVRSKASAELHRIKSASPPLSPIDTTAWANLDHAVTAPQVAPNGHIEPSRTSGYNLLSPTSPTSHYKREKLRDDKDRKAAEKAAEKEREKAEKNRRREVEQKLKDVQKKQADDLKAAMEASKASKVDEDLRNGGPDPSSRDAGQTNGIGSKDLFRRTKSLRFGSLGRKDKPVLHEEPMNGSVVEESATEGKEDEKDMKKKNRFSLRKKSFNLM